MREVLARISAKIRYGHRSCLSTNEGDLSMYPILYIIGAIVVVIVILKVLGLF
jgi:hypothetical protein